MNGFLVVDKPGGMSSHDVIARCRRVFGVRRIGHAGTLDPPATGILLVGVGRGTRLLRFLEAHDKEYRADIVFGLTTTTQDASGEHIEQRDASTISPDRLRHAMDGFRGAIEQVPPMVSAVKVGGERLYRKARRGEEIVRTPRRVEVHELVLEDFAPGTRARATIRVVCSKGTYVRTLAADLGASLGVGAHVGTLRRVRIGPFDESGAVALDAVTSADLRSMDEALAGYPRRDVDQDLARALVHGKALPAAGMAGPYAVWGPSGLVAVCEDRGEEARSLCVVTDG